MTTELFTFDLLKISILDNKLTSNKSRTFISENVNFWVSLETTRDAHDYSELSDHMVQKVDRS